MKMTFTLTAAALSVTACASIPSADAEFDMTTPTVVPVVHQPVAEPVGAEDASLWTTSPNALLSMRRAKAVGDLLTVVVEMDDRASLQSSLSRNRNSSADMNVDALFGLPEWANGVLPGGASLSPGVDYSRGSSLDGSGAMNRAESIAFTLAAPLSRSISTVKR